jgi:hypothetical protein
MDLKTTLNFEVTKNDRVYRVILPLGAPYGEAYDAVFACLEGIVNLQKKGVEQLKAQAAGEVNAEPITPVNMEVTQAQTPEFQDPNQPV